MQYQYNIILILIQYQNNIKIILSINIEFTFKNIKSIKYRFIIF
jgi:hypothetical protein